MPRGLTFSGQVQSYIDVLDREEDQNLTPKEREEASPHPACGTPLPVRTGRGDGGGGVGRSPGALPWALPGRCPRLLTLCPCRAGARAAALFDRLWSPVTKPPVLWDRLTLGGLLC